jgi:AcrR family transcriptional regulator
MVARKRPPKRRPAEKKSDATRRHLLDKALALFHKRGVAGTTMRDIARAAGMSLGAAYYYFPSKEALVFAFYEQNQTEMEAVEVAGTLRERLGTLFHGKLDTIRDQRAMLAAIIQRLVDPGDPLSAFSAQSRAVRERAIAILARALDGAVPADVVPLVATGLWLFQLASMLVYVHDTSPSEARTHGLVDDGLDLIVPMLPILGTPMGRAFADRASAALARAGIALVV